MTASENCQRHRRLQRQLRSDAVKKRQVIREIASVIALSLQKKQHEIVHGELFHGIGRRKHGLLASTLRLAEQNVSDMTLYLQERKARGVTMRASEKQATKTEERGTCEPKVCGVCLEGVVINGAKTNEGEEEWTILPCGHTFHVQCITQWLQYQRVCPMDRQPVD